MRERGAGPLTSADAIRPTAAAKVSRHACARAEHGPFEIVAAARAAYTVLIQCALAAVRSGVDGYFAAKYERISRRRGKKRALVAVARMMMVSLYHMLSNGEVFNPSDHDSPARAREDCKALAEQSALDLLRALGYDISAPAPVG